MAHNSFFASDLGWTPGTWPHSFKHEGKTYNRRKEVLHGGEFVGFEYFCQTDGVHVTVWND